MRLGVLHPPAQRDRPFHPQRPGPEVDVAWPEGEDVCRNYAEGLAAYRARRFDEALAYFEKALAADPGDGPSAEMRGRCIEFVAHPPPPEWGGEHVLTSK